MSGVTCTAFRRLIRRLNPDSVGLLVSEFLSVEGMTRNGRRTLQMMKFHEEERPFSIQIFGKDPARMRDAAIMVEESGADMVDINCGCPAPKVVRRGGGAELMRQPAILASILREVRKAVTIPVTLKIRAGWDQQSRNAMEIAKLAEGEGIDGLAIHGRTRAQMYQGEADWDLVEEVAEALSIPVCGSGDVVDLESARARLRGKIAGLYIGRAALSNPYVFREIAHGEQFRIRTRPAEAIDVVRQYMDLLLEDYSEQAAIGRVKQLICRLAPRSWWWKTTVLRKLTIAEILAVLEEASQYPEREAHEIAPMVE